MSKIFKDVEVQDSKTITVLWWLRCGQLWTVQMVANVYSFADGHPPTADTCNAAIRSCDPPRWREQLELLQEMRRTFGGSVGVKDLSERCVEVEASDGNLACCWIFMVCQKVGYQKNSMVTSLA